MGKVSCIHEALGQQRIQPIKAQDNDSFDPASTSDLSSLHKYKGRPQRPCENGQEGENPGGKQDEKRRNKRESCPRTDIGVAGALYTEKKKEREREGCQHEPHKY